jgi:hypothetical protein
MKTSQGWIQRWRVQQGICQINTESESARGDRAASEQFPETIHNVNGDGENNEQLYNCDKTALYYKPPANKSLDLRKSTQKSGYEN